jgi:segregation and condensation protein B
MEGWKPSILRSPDRPGHSMPKGKTVFWIEICANLRFRIMVTLKAVVEALLFSTQKPLTTHEIWQTIRLGSEHIEGELPAELGESTEELIRQTVQELADNYRELGRAFQLVEQVSGWQLATRSEYQLWVRQLFPDLRPARLSAPALETLAIVAYRQPITKADIEAIRGVTIDGVLQKLLDVGLVKIAGRAEIPGRPLLYETTQHFMEHFGLRDLNELPNASELRSLTLPTAKSAETSKQSQTGPSDQVNESVSNALPSGSSETGSSQPAQVASPDQTNLTDGERIEH